MYWEKHIRTTCHSSLDKATYREQSKEQNLQGNEVGEDGFHKLASYRLEGLLVGLDSVLMGAWIQCPTHGVT